MSERFSVVEQMMSKTLHECQHRRWTAILPMVDNKSSVMLHSTVHTHWGAKLRNKFHTAQYFL